MDTPEKRVPFYEQIYAVVKQIPYGKVASYGQISRIIGKGTARMVGYAMSALRIEGVPWHRVINSQGKISPHGDGIGSMLQHDMLMDEGVVFDLQGRVDFDVFGWNGPGEGLLEASVENERSHS